MAGLPQKKPHQRKPLLAGVSKLSAAQIDPHEKIVFSFRHFDPAQGQTFGEWAEAGLLVDLLEKFRHYSNSSFDEAKSDKFKVYGPLTPETWPSGSEFKHPNHVPPDAQWACMHVKGMECVIGHRLKNVFCVVFLDRYHKFWPSELKNT